MNIQLNHECTPQALADINAEILQCLTDDDEEARYSTLLSLMTRRDTVIQSHLRNSDPETARSFAEQEVTVNNMLKEMAQTLLKSAKDDVSQFLRSQKAVKKYR